MQMEWTTLRFASLLVGLWLSVATAKCATNCPEVHCDWNTRGDTALTITNCPSVHNNDEPTLTLQRTAPFDAASDEETVESVFFPGTMVPPDVEKSLAELLSPETVKWIDEHDANGHASEGISINGQYIPADMKDAIRNYVKKYTAEPHMQGTKGPMIEERTVVRDRGTDVGSPQSDLQRRLLDLDCRQQHSLDVPAASLSLVEKWMKQLGDVILRKEILVVGMGFVLMVSSVSALLFVYGVSDVCSGILSFWHSTRNAVERFRKSHEELPQKCDEQQLSMEKSHSKQNGKHNARAKNKDPCMNGKSASKKRHKSHPSPKTRNDQTDAAYKKDAWKDKKTSAKGKQMKGRSEDEHDENNDWQEVMHSKPKGRSVRPKQVMEEEEKSFSQPKSVPSKQPTSQPMTPKTPELQHQPPTAMKSEQEYVAPAVKPIRTSSHGAVHKEHWRVAEGPSENLQLTMTTSGAFADEKSLTNRFEMNQMPFGDVQFIQHSPVQQSPFAASMDVPFFNSSPVRGGYPAIQSPTTEEQFQSKVDCLLRNLRSKPFSVHPVSSSPHPPLRRSVTDLEEQMLANRLTALNLQQTMSGSLDPAFSSSGMLNNRLAPPFLQPQFTDDIRMTRQMSGGLSMTRPARITSQRAGSLPLAPQNQSMYPLCNQGSMKTSKNALTLSSDCSLFSSNPSIWSVDLAVDRDFVESSMPNNTKFKPSAFASEEQSMDFKRCLPDQLLTEMGSLNES